jgi:hypothetical protein
MKRTYGRGARISKTGIVLMGKRELGNGNDRACLPYNRIIILTL